ncbi:nitrilase-related carbon-nitrogen hydrolase [Defluviimonas aestuarii]|uniref:nitrilase-related carbon-nitrogen hydrolase n=1 Tax=Albidovulum aestuarii TaxID=1130726 RepID=UPI002499E818|nr:nitrilase-related carbon-nitrogen hydrolase [Defluviimonas aestuarii]MDI3336428.1 nitrilase-related carbon-nitrogen hydrolase [Defluviimonas aestuarii]
MRVAIFQSAGGGRTPGERIAALKAAIAAGRPDLVVCPELFLSGYAAPADIARYAEGRDGSLQRAVAALAKAQNCAIVCGCPERDGGTLYNSAAFFGADGSLVAHHRKLAFPSGFESDTFTAGNRIEVFDYGGIRFALLICCDSEIPETMRLARRKGAEAVLVPTALTANWPGVAEKLIPTRAFENCLWVCYANHAGTEGGLTYLGKSCIVRPDGEDAARAGAGHEMISAEIEQASVAAAQARLPYLGAVLDIS